MSRPYDAASQPVDYDLLEKQAEGLMAGISRQTTNAANLSALIFSQVPGLNWAGFYFVDGDDLWLGPFQGQPACTRIPLGEGVCGQAAASGKNLRVRDVHEFEGHIACDAASNSELVIPLFRDDVVFGVLDLDSPHFGRFSAEDEKGLERLARAFEQSLA